MAGHPPRDREQLGRNPAHQQFESPRAPPFQRGDQHHRVFVRGIVGQGLRPANSFAKLVQRYLV